MLSSAKTAQDLQALEELLNECETQEAPTDDKWVVRDQSEVAEFFDVHPQTVKEWRKESPPMPGEKGHWPLKEIVRWRFSKLTRSDLADAKRRADIQRTMLKVESDQLDLAQKKGELVERAEVERFLGALITEARAGFMSVPNIVASMLPKEGRDEIRANIDRHIRDVLETLARRLEEDEISSESGESVQAT